MNKHANHAINFDEIIDRRHTHSSKWDTMESVYGVSPDDGISMWVADTDFRAPKCVNDAVQAMVDHGIYGYFGDETAYNASIAWWMSARHGWQIEPEWIFTTHGLCNGTALCVETFTQPGDGVILFTPVYHSFAKIIRASGRDLVECPLELDQGRYVMDLEAAEASLKGHEKMVVFCSPHNPGGRVWDVSEIKALADFCARNDLLLVSDEIHHDLVYPGQKHTIAALAVPEHLDRLVMMSAPTKTFNIAGCHNGNVIIPNEGLRRKFAHTIAALNLSPNSFGQHMTTAAYSPDGAIWVDALMVYLEENQRIFDGAMNALPGVRSMPLEATYLSWVDFSGTGMSATEFTRRVEHDAKIAVNYGETFGSGGQSYLRFNIGLPKSRIIEACTRLTDAFGDLQ